MRDERRFEKIAAIMIILGGISALPAGASPESEVKSDRPNVLGEAQATPSGAATGSDVKNDYPTAARADYVFACMATNGQNQAALYKCSCSIDVIASMIPYEKYVQSETILRMQLVDGEKSAMFRGAAWIKEVVDDLRRAQAEAESRCF